jgi:hypothetical protein
MAKCKVSLVKKSAPGTRMGARGTKAGPVVDFQFVDNEDDTCTVQGLDAVGNTVDISAVATLTPVPTSSDVTKVVVDPPNGMTFAIHAVGPVTTPGSPVQIAVTATWNDSSLGPFSFSLPVDVVVGPAASIIIVPGTPTVH